MCNRNYAVDSDRNLANSNMISTYQLVTIGFEPEGFMTIESKSAERGGNSNTSYGLVSP